MHKEVTSEEITYELSTTLRADAPETNHKYHIWTIGCQMNIADSNHVAAELEKIGYSPTEKMDDADVVVLNTALVLMLTGRAKSPLEAAKIARDAILNGKAGGLLKSLQK